jgi:hypothetical protein
VSHSVNDNGKVVEILKNTRGTLRMTELALEDLAHGLQGERRAAAVCNVVTSGRSVTFALQNLSSVAPGFDDWYTPWSTEMANDPLLKYLKNLRNEIVHKGPPRFPASIHIKSFRPSDLPPRPPNAVGYVIGDEYGGSGWQVQLEDGTIQTMYYTFPEDRVRTWLTFGNLPRKHLGGPSGDNTVENVCRLYVQYLRRLVDAAEKEFGGSASSSR